MEPQIATPWPSSTVNPYPYQQPQTSTPTPLADNLDLLYDKKDAHSNSVELVAFSRDGTKIMSLGCNTIKVWDSGAPRARHRPSVAKTNTRPRLSRRFAGATGRKDARARRHNSLGRVFPGWDQDRVRIGRWDDQNLGFRCGPRALNIAPSMANTNALLSCQSNKLRGCSARRRTPTAPTSTRWRFRQTGPRLSQSRPT